MKKLHETVYILSKCNQNIQTVWEAISKHQQKSVAQSRSHFTFNLLHYIILEATSYLEEYSKRFTAIKVEEDFRDRLSDVRKIIKPIHKRINQWPDLAAFRDNIVAHPWRDGSRFVLPQDNSYRVPRSMFEYQLLKDFINYSYQVINSEFSNEIGQAYLLAERMKEDVFPKLEFAEVNEDIRALKNELVEKCNELNKEYDLQLYFYE